jgi:NAD(P)H-dependent flavin oxidoreductase YrpB (nitropropane dioxygenase family)
VSELAASGGQAASANQSSAPAPPPVRTQPIRTRLTELAGIRYPIVQTGMGFVAGARLVAATSGAGGLGIVGSATMTLDALRTAVKQVKERTDAPFGVNIRADAPDAAERIELMIAERVAVASFALAPRREQIARLKDAGLIVIPSVGARRHAEKVAEWGADAVIVQGGEGGGHTGPIPTSLLVPQVVSSVDIPVVAAGGFFDGRGLIAALAYGAEGIAMGTRFLLTSDSPVADAVKRVYLGKSLTDTVVTTRVDGVPHRVLRTPLIDALERSGPVAGLARAVRNAVAFRGVSGLTWRQMLREGAAMRRGSDLTWSQVLMAANTPMLLKAAMVDGNPDLGVMAAGQVVGVIDDLPSCAELIDRVMAQAHESLARLRGYA